MDSVLHRASRLRMQTKLQSGLHFGIYFEGGKSQLPHRDQTLLKIVAGRNATTFQQPLSITICFVRLIYTRKVPGIFLVMGINFSGVGLGC